MTESTDRDLIEVVIDGQPTAVAPGSTIFDAAERLGIAIPSLCHDKSLPPAGVCRMCVVDVGEPTLTPACCRTVDSLPHGYRVATHRTSDRVRKSIETLLELLLAEHPDWKPGTPVADEWLESAEVRGQLVAPAIVAGRSQRSEVRSQWSVVRGQSGVVVRSTDDSRSTIHDLRSTSANAVIALAERFGLSRSRFTNRTKGDDRDNTSPIIAVDRSACILCERCVRACGDVHQHRVIGRGGFSHEARIVFDLDRPLADSLCVACGECVPKCPTGALAFRANGPPTRDEQSRVAWSSRVTAQELKQHPFFVGLADELLDWLAANIVRRRLQPGEVICREAERGSTAFLIETGDVQVSLDTPFGHVHSWKGPEAKTRWGPFGLVRRFETTLEHDESVEQPAFIPIDAPEFLPRDRPIAVLHAGDVFGEATAMLNQPRSATARAMSAVTVLELPRAAMYVLRQNPASRAWLDEAYLDRAWPQHLVRVTPFARLVGDSDSLGDLARRLRPHVRFHRFAPGDVVVRLGDRVDAVWLVRFGFVEESGTISGESHVQTYIGPGGHFGGEALWRSIEEGNGSIPTFEAPVTWRAITAVDVAVLDFTAIVDVLPSPLGASGDATATRAIANSIDSLVLNHLARAEHLLAVDLAKCIHCDDCVRGCGAAHDGVSRLVPDGMRFDGRLLPTTCITCLNPVCLIGCPVGAIGRLASREVAIDDWCIGCGLCAEQCPYGNVVMHATAATCERLPHETQIDSANMTRERTTAAVVTKPTTCDGCRDLVGRPPCVAACAHAAIHRVAGPDFTRLDEKT